MDLLGVLYCLLVSTSVGQAMWWDGFDTQEELGNFSLCKGPDSDWIDYRVHSVDFRDLSIKYPNIPYKILDQLVPAVGIWGLLYFESNIPGWVRDPHSFSCKGSFQVPIPSHVRIQYFLYGGSFIELTSDGNLLQRITNDCTTPCTPEFKEAIIPLAIDSTHDFHIRMNTTAATDVVLIDDISFSYTDTPPTTATTTTTTSTITPSTTTTSTVTTTPSTTATSTTTTAPSTTMASPTENVETTPTFQTTTSSQTRNSTTEATTVTAETAPTTIAYTTSTEQSKSTASIPDPPEVTSTPDLDSTPQANTTVSISTSTDGKTADQDAPETSTIPEFTSATDNSTSATTPDGASVTQLSWSLLLFSFCLYKLISSVSG